MDKSNEKHCPRQIQLQTLYSLVLMGNPISMKIIYSKIVAFEGQGLQTLFSDHVSALKARSTQVSEKSQTYAKKTGWVQIIKWNSNDCPEDLLFLE